MFYMITNSYNKKTKGPNLMEYFTATGIFFTTRDVRCVHHGWHGTHRYDIQVLDTGDNIFWQLEMFDVCTTGDTAHIDTIFKFLTHASIFFDN